MEDRSGEDASSGHNIPIQTLTNEFSTCSINDPEEDLTLSDILDQAELQPLFDDFYRIVHIPMSLVDMSGKILVGIGWQDICKCFHRVNPETRKNCLESDLHLTENIEPGKYIIYKCKNNMWDVATPIFAGETKLGNLFMGNFFFDDDEIDYDLFRQQARRFGFDEDGYMAALDKVPRLSHETIDSAMSFFIKLGRYLSLQGMANLKLARVIEQNGVLMKEIAASREMLELFLNSTKEIAFLKNEVLQHQMVNEAYLEFLEKPRDEVIGRTDFELMPPDLAEQCHKGDEEVIRNGEPSIAREFGNGKVFESRKFPVFFSDGTTGIGGFIRDVTDLWKAEESKKESEERFRSIFDNATIGLYRTTPDGKIQMANPTLVKMLGYSTFEELAGRDLNKEGFEPDYQRRIFMERIERESVILGLESAWSRKDGTTLFVRESARAFRDPDGNVLYYEGTVEDVTELKESENKLRRALRATIEVLTQTVERRDPYTAGHQKRVAALAEGIAIEMGLDPDRVEGIKMAGYVHDIGKISIPSEILSKPGKLSVLEMNIIKEHPANGRDILKDVETAWPLDEIVHQHHERMDGSGYPRGLKGGEILLEARILCVADVVEAMASHRPYRPTLGIEVALEEIEKNRGTLYDPQVVDTCLSLFRKKGYSLIE